MPQPPEPQIRGEIDSRFQFLLAVILRGPAPGDRSARSGRIFDSKDKLVQPLVKCDERHSRRNVVIFRDVAAGSGSAKWIPGASQLQFAAIISEHFVARRRFSFCTCPVNGEGSDFAIETEAGEKRASHDRLAGPSGMHAVAAFHVKSIAKALSRRKAGSQHWPVDVGERHIFGLRDFDIDIAQPKQRKIKVLPCARGRFNPRRHAVNRPGRA